jgi:RNA polymerase sigma factor (TIGR02999 family)
LQYPIAKILTIILESWCNFLRRRFVHDGDLPFAPTLSEATIAPALKSIEAASVDHRNRSGPERMIPGLGHWNEALSSGPGYNDGRFLNAPHGRRIDMSDVTRILSAIEQGDSQAAEQLLPLVYDELRKLAAQQFVQEKPGQTLQSTALVHEAYLRLVDVKQVQHWNSRGHFFAAAAEAMRRILVERARRKGRIRHGGGLRRAELFDENVAAPADGEQILVLDEALTRLAAARPQAAELVKLRFFTGLTLEEIAPMLAISPRTARRLWAFARAWLRREMERSDESAT